MTDSRTPDRIPDKLWAWSFNTWASGWGGYARQSRLAPLTDRERNTGAVFVREDLALRDVPTSDLVEELRRREVGDWHE